VITGSEFCARDLRARYRVDGDKIAVIPLGAAPRFRPRARAETTAVLARYGLGPGFLFSLGRLNRRKNLERLLLAHARLRASGAGEVPLVIAGQPDYGAEEVLRRAQVAADSTGVFFPGLVPDADLPYFYAGAVCFVYPSLFEGFGLPLIEAMACGTPIVSSDRAALPELVGGGPSRRPRGRRRPCRRHRAGRERSRPGRRARRQGISAEPGLLVAGDGAADPCHLSRSRRRLAIRAHRLRWRPRPGAQRRENCAAAQPRGR
jgi:Glycosyl transferases group 1